MFVTRKIVKPEKLCYCCIVALMLLMVFFLAISFFRCPWLSSVVVESEIEQQDYISFATTHPCGLSNFWSFGFGAVQTLQKNATNGGVC